MTGFILKLIAMSTMIIDHMGFLFFDNSYAMRAIGRIAFIVYAFLMAESYFHLKDKPDRLGVHFIKLMILALVTEIPHDLCEEGKLFELSSQNALLPLWLGFSALIVMGWWKKRCGENTALAGCGCAVITLAAAAFSYFIKTEYPFAGVILIVLFFLYLRREDNWPVGKRLAVLFAIVAFYLLIHLWSKVKFRGPDMILYAARVQSYRITGSLPVIFPLALYNRKLGYNGKWFRWFYSGFYPLQFIVLDLILFAAGRL